MQGERREKEHLSRWQLRFVSRCECTVELIEKYLACLQAVVC